MPDMKIPRQSMPIQAPEVRKNNFLEVSLGYTEEMAILEASRCLNCKNSPCVSGCPVGIAIPDFLKYVAQGDPAGAYRVINSASSLPAVCGRVCPQEKQCESKCVRGIKGEAVAIGRVERFVADWKMAHPDQAEKPVSNGLKVAIIGAGPAGLTCAGDLARRGFAVTVFEALHVAGGVLVYGIPEFRLPKKIVQNEINALLALGVEINTDMVIGRVLTIDDLFDMGYKAVFIGTGAGLPRFMGIEGENLRGVYSANEFLTRVNLMKAYQENADTPIRKGKSVVVVGGGNVAMDAARCALRLGAEQVHIVYRRGEAEMPARREEVEHAKEEGVLFDLLCNPVRVNGNADSDVTGVTCVRMTLGEPDASGRRKPQAEPGSDFDIPCDVVVMALGTTPNPLIRQTTDGLETDAHGCILTRDETGLTSREHVYAGGDAVTGAATVIQAMGAGKAAAEAIAKQLTE